MTSQIAIFNSLGVALASDTVTTHVSGRASKTTNNAEKIMLIGPGHLVAVAHSGSTEINWTHLRNMMNAWSATLVEPLRRLEDYPASFVQWVASDGELLNPESEIDLATKVLSEHYSRVMGTFQALTTNEDEPMAAPQALLTAAQKAIDYVESLPLYEGVTDEEDAQLIAQDAIDLSQILVDWFGEYEGFEQALPRLRESASRALSRCDEMPFGTELGFVGFGQDDHFAKSVRLKVRGRYGNRVRAKASAPFGISNTQPSPAAYQTFAQAEAVHGFLRGAQWAVTNEAVDYAWNAVYEAIDGDDDDDVDVANKIAGALRDHIEEFCDARFSQPILNTIGGMSLLNLAELATSLVGMQAMFSSAAGSGTATVGGFIETLLISRAHGIQWINRIPGAPK